MVSNWEVLGEGCEEAAAVCTVEVFSFVHASLSRITAAAEIKAKMKTNPTNKLRPMISPS